VYVGEWIKGLQEGNGTALYNNGNKYTGQFSQGFKVNNLTGLFKYSIWSNSLCKAQFVNYLIVFSSNFLKKFISFKKSNFQAFNLF